MSFVAKMSSSDLGWRWTRCGCSGAPYSELRKPRSHSRVTSGRCVFGAGEGVCGSARRLSCEEGRTSCSHSVTRARARQEVEETTGAVEGLLRWPSARLAFRSPAAPLLFASWFLAISDSERGERGDLRRGSGACPQLHAERERGDPVSVRPPEGRPASRFRPAAGGVAGLGCRRRAEERHALARAVRLAA